MPEITVGDLIDELQKKNPAHRMSFSGLEYSRLRQRDVDLVQLEFEQVVYRDAEDQLVAHDP